MGTGAIGYVRFGPFEADLTTGELFRDGQLVRLQQKPFHILELLLCAEGALVSRERIAETVWPGVHVEVAGSLNAAMRKLRVALGDDSSAPTFIETVGSRGYRFLPRVIFPKKQELTSGRLSPTLAVLPFRNLNQDSEDYFSDGLTEQMIAQVGRYCGNISVIAPLSVMHYKGRSDHLSQIGRELNSDYLLCGSVLRTSQRFRINAKLIRTEDQACLWADSYTRDESDIFAVQDEITFQIAQAILNSLPVHAGHNETSIAPSEYEKYLKACFFAAKGTEPDFLKAFNLFQEVIADNPYYGPAYSSLAVLCAESGQYGVLPPKVIYDRVHTLATQALKLSEHLPEGHVALGYEHFFYRADLTAAEKCLSRALELNHSFSLAYLGYGMLMASWGRYHESIAAMRRARELDPFSPMANALLATSLCVAGRLQDAVEQARRTIDIEPNFPTGHACLGWALTMLGEHDAALDAYRAAVACCPQSRLMLAHLAHGLALAGKRDEARNILQDLIQARTTAWTSPYWIALGYVGLGEYDSALDWLDIAMDERDGWRLYCAVDGRLNPISSHPRLVDIREELFKTQAVKERAEGFTTGKN